MSDRVMFWRLLPDSGAVCRWAKTIEEAAEQLDRAAEIAGEIVMAEHERGASVPNTYRFALLWLDSKLMRYPEYGSQDTAVREVVFEVIVDHIRKVYGYVSTDAVRLELSRHEELLRWVGQVIPPNRGSREVSKPSRSAAHTRPAVKVVQPEGTLRRRSG